MKKALIRTVQAIFTIAILIYLFNSPEKRGQMGAAFSRADANWMLIGLPVAFVGEIANIIRWNILLRVQGMRIGWLRLAQLFFVGLFFNLFMPGYTGGDFARLFYSMREFPDRKKEAVLTIVMDRLIGMLALVVTAVAHHDFPLAMAPTDASGVVLCLGLNLHVDWVFGVSGWVISH